MQKLTFRPVIIACSLLIAFQYIQADVLKMPEQRPSYSVTMPGRGMTMTGVEKQFGAPLQKLPEVGDPPITEWKYQDFTVYFEYQYVIHALINKNPAAQANPEQQPAEKEPAQPSNGAQTTPHDPDAQTTTIY